MLNHYRVDRWHGYNLSELLHLVFCEFFMLHSRLEYLLDKIRFSLYGVKLMTFVKSKKYKIKKKEIRACP
jgi:hypothetical protein